MPTMWETNSILNTLKLYKFQGASGWLLLVKNLYIPFTVDFEQEQSGYLTLLKSNSLDTVLPKSAFETHSNGCLPEAPYSMSDWVLNTPLVPAKLTHLFPMHPFSTPWKHQKTGYITGIYILKVNKNTKTRCEICSNLTIKTPKRRLSTPWKCPKTLRFVFRG